MLLRLVVTIIAAVGVGFVALGCGGGDPEEGERRDDEPNGGPCIPRQASQGCDEGWECGLIDDGCGGYIDCGDCSYQCVPLTCSELGGECGIVADGCGGELDCGDCQPTDPCAEESRQPPPGWTRLTTGNLSCKFLAGVGMDGAADCSRWDGLWGGPFPSGQGLPHRLGVGRFSPEEYLAIEISTDGLPADGTVDIIQEGPGSGVQISGPRIVTISSCPGDFDFDAVGSETGCTFVLTNLIDRIRIGGIDTDRACRLQPESTYFLNIIHSDSPEGTPADELESNCDQELVDEEDVWICGVLYHPTTNF